jgi:hypothetical protein
MTIGAGMDPVMAMDDSVRRVTFSVVIAGLVPVIPIA